MKQTHKSREADVRNKRIRRQSGGNDELRLRHEERQRKRNRQIAAIRTVLMFLLIAILVCVILFMTPLFNIRRITVSGNNAVTLEEINQYIGDLNGKNLLKTAEHEIKHRLSAIAYIKEVSVQKNYFKTSLNVSILEREPCGYLGLSGKNVLFDDECVILAETTEKPENIPLIIGISDSDDVNEALNMGEEKTSAMLESIKLMRELGFLDKVDNLDLSDIEQIKFQYDDRLDVLCGSQIDTDRKLRLFEAMINNDNLADNAQGTVDLTVTGNARYSPERAKSIKTGNSNETSKKQSSQKNEKE